jgi:hypothetical protein
MEAVENQHAGAAVGALVGPDVGVVVGPDVGVVVGPDSVPQLLRSDPVARPASETTAAVVCSVVHEAADTLPMAARAVARTAVNFMVLEVCWRALLGGNRGMRSLLSDRFTQE